MNDEIPDELAQTAQYHTLLLKRLSGELRVLVKTIRENVTIDWTEKQSVRARLRVMVKRVLRKYGYPPRQAGKSDTNGPTTGRTAVR